MKNKISVLFLLYLICPFYLSKELLFVLYSAMLIFTLMFYRVPITKNLFRIITPLLLLLIVGALTLIVGDNSFRDILRDFAYFIHPIITICLGYITFFRVKNISTILNTTVFAGIIVSLDHLSSFIVNPLLITESLYQIRNVAGNGYIITVVAVLLIIFNRKYYLNIFNNKKAILFISFIICFASFALSLSRTLLLALLIMFPVVSFSKINFKKKIKLTHLRISFSVFALLLIIIASYLFYPEKIVNQMYGKISTTVEELSIDKDWDWKAINENWRGYETYMAIQKYKDANITKKIFGYGFGAKVDLGVDINLNGKVYSSVAVLHNGYMYILIKTGLLGLMLYLIFIISVIRNSLSLLKISDFYGRLMLSLALIIMFNTYTVTGVFNSTLTSTTVLLLGVLTSYSYLKYKRIISTADSRDYSKSLLDKNYAL